MNWTSFLVALAAFLSPLFVPVPAHALEKDDVVVFLGDSITSQGARRDDGFIKLIDAKLKDEGITCIGAGIGGHKVPDCQKRLERDVLAKNPTHVVIFIGINDVWHHKKGEGRGTPKFLFRRGLMNVVDRCEAVGATVILCTPSVIGEKKADGENTFEGVAGTFDWDEMLDDYANITRALARERRLTLVDLRKDFKNHIKANNPDNNERGILTGDRVHLNAAGNKLVAEKMLVGLRRADFMVPSENGLVGAGPTRFNRDWFQRLWSTKRSGWAADAEKDQGAVVFLGDSITQGWNADMRKQFRDMKVANRGISGDTTRGMLARLEQDVLALNPKGVVILAGTNDIEDNGAVADGAANMKAILAALKQHNPDMPIVFNRMFPSSAKKGRGPEKIEAFNKAFDELVKGDSQITVLDTWTLFATADKDAQPKFFPDLLHLNQKGYERWAASLRPVLETLDLLDSPADDFELEDGYEWLFNGKDLTGWQFKKTTQRNPKKPKPSTAMRPVWKEDIVFDGKTETVDRRYIADDGRLVVTVPPSGRRFQQMWTTREFGKNFTLKLEFRASPNADSGIFIRKPQLQCRDYHIAGPYKDLENYKPLDWNEVVIEVKGGSARCTCNGDVLEEAFAVPASGPIGLEGDRGQMEYRRIRIKEQ